MSNLPGAKKIGRPRVDTEAVNVRMPMDMIAALDTLIAQMPDPKPSRPEAVRQIVAASLKLIARDRS